MSDDDLKSMLTNMKERFGSLPPTLEDYNNKDISGLSEEELSAIREQMAEDIQNMSKDPDSYLQPYMQAHIDTWA